METEYQRTEESNRRIRRQREARGDMAVLFLACCFGLVSWLGYNSRLNDAVKISERKDREQALVQTVVREAGREDGILGLSHEEGIKLARDLGVKVNEEYPVTLEYRRGISEAVLENGPDRQFIPVEEMKRYLGEPSAQ